MSQVMAMSKRLKEAEETIDLLRAQMSASSCGDSTSHTSTSPQVAAAPSTEAGNSSFANLARPNNTSPHSIPSVTETSTLQARTQSTLSPLPTLETSETLPPGLTVDENGELQYYGPTSAVHDPPQHLKTGSPPEVSSVTHQDSSKMEIMSYTQESNIWEEFALGNASLQTGIPRQIMAKLLHMHWTWVSPMFMYVYRPGKIFKFSHVIDIYS